jgi:hypothetical protein
MPLFICRWSDGDCSAVFARDIQIATKMLDEIGSVSDDKCAIFEAPHFMMHFKLCDRAVDRVNDETPIALEYCGEQFWSQLMERAYPEYYAEILNDDMTVESVDKALQRERERLA